MPHILIVDDNPDGLLALEAALSSSAYTLVKANSGQEALKCLLEQDFAVILLDIQMPELDGLETAAIIKKRERSKDIPIIFITANSEDEKRVHEGYEKGAVDYLFKPFDPVILKSKVRIFADIYKKNTEIKRQAELLRRNEEIRREEALARLELESFQRYRDLADAIPHMVWRGYAIGTMDYFNKGWCDFTGLTVEQSSGVGWRSMIHPDDLKSLLEVWESSVETSLSFEMECRIKNGKNGEFRWHLLRVVPEKSRSGRVTAWIGTNTDIHDRKHAGEEMEKAREAALVASRLKSDFIANVSHEIRTPLNGIIGTANLLLDSPLNKDQQKLTQIIEDSGSILLSLINDILDFSKIESGKMELEIIDFSLRSVIENQVELLAARAHEKHHSLMTFVSPDIPPLLRGDPGRLGQVLLNLTSNAIKFTERGKISVEADYSTGQDSNPNQVTVRFAVRDTGIGLSEAVKQNLFQPFTQADGSMVRKYGGTGLGLSICKRLVELMGGQIGVDSEEGKGSTFWFTICFERAQHSSTSLETDPDIESNFAVKDLRLLIVSEDPNVRTIVQRYILAWGLAHDSFASGEDALKQLRQEANKGTPYPIVLMDKVMPDMDGFALARSIRSDTLISGSRLLLVTPDYSPHLEKEALAAGFSGVLLKPFKRSKLFNLLTTASDHKDKKSSPTPDSPIESPKGVTSPLEAHVLVVEDSSVNQLVCERHLKKLGYSVHVVTNGVEAIEAVTRSSYDLILMDCQMPGMDGFAATRAIRKMNSSPMREVPIIAVTAHAMKEDKTKCFEAGMDDYISKPIDFKLLGSKIEKWVVKKSKKLPKAA